jgi:chemotaxis signal transduction protein
MTTVVRFRAPSGDYAIGVEHVSEVRSTADLTSLPEPREGVAGLMRRDGDALSVLSMLAPEGDHIVVVHVDQLSFGLLVEEVVGVHQVDEADLGPPPRGQDRVVVSGVFHDDETLVLVLDVHALAAKLSS